MCFGVWSQEMACGEARTYVELMSYSWRDSELITK
jgi:hypothetical protein